MRFAAIVVPLALLAACSPPTQTEAPAPRVEMSAQARSTMERINSSRFTATMSETFTDRARPEDGAGATLDTAASTQTPANPAGDAPVAAEPATEVEFDAGLVRMQVLLDRAHFSPGVIDGYDGSNVRKAVSAYQHANDLPVTGLADDALLTRLEQADASPAIVAYTITEEDIAGPFVNVPQDLEAMSRLQQVGYGSAAEAIAEKFHMDEDLLRTLNPGADFSTAGAEIVVANAGGELEAAVASIEIDTREQAVRAFDASGNLLAYYPATVGSSEAPSPTGEHSVRAVAFDPTYRYDPERLPTFGERDHGALTIAAGPNNPVGAVWIALSADTYGIHGAPFPERVSKSASHGCVRLTNWDAIELGRAVTAGVPVHFGAGAGLAEAERSRG
ncbi:MAG: L,D-transpeptidase [Hyphomonadaceae bacterium]|nr:L,D-transpeptidase [Hyphomonadaceae bacterium]